MAVQQALKVASQQSVALSGTAAATTATPLPAEGENVLIVNATAATVLCDFGTTATLASPYVVPANGWLLVTIGNILPLFASAIGASAATGNVFFMRGDGMTY